MGKSYSWLDFSRDYWLLLKGRRARFVIFSTIRAMSTFATFATTFFLGLIIDYFTKYNPGNSLNKFYLLVVAIAMTASFQVMFRFYAKNNLQVLAAQVRKEARLLATKKLLDMDLKDQEKEATGAKIQKINAGGDSISECMQMFSNDGIEMFATILGPLLIFLFIDLRYFAFTLMFCLAWVYAEYSFNRKLSELEAELSEMRENVSGKIHDSASNIMTVKSLGLNHKLHKKAEETEEKYYAVWIRRKNLSQTKTTLIKVSAAITYAGFILLLGFDVIWGIITVGSILIYSAYLGRARDGLDKLSSNLDKFTSLKASFGRFMDFAGKDLFLSKKTGKVQSGWKEISFENVTFAYDKRLVLKGINLKIKRGEKVGVVGRSGCGKSTLTKLLLGLYMPQSGRISIGKSDISVVESDSLTDTVAAVLQESEMFNMTLKENITISSDKVNETKLKEALSSAKLEGLIQKLPQKENTLLGEKGHKLSGGERQRIGIARAIYKDAQVLVFDEATSHLDSKTEKDILFEISKLKGKTMIMIAHRLSTLNSVDRIIVLDSGRIVEQGTFDELLTRKGQFYKLYNIQAHKLKE